MQIIWSPTMFQFLKQQLNSLKKRKTKFLIGFNLWSAGCNRWLGWQWATTMSTLVKRPKETMKFGTFWPKCSPRFSTTIFNSTNTQCVSIVSTCPTPSARSIFISVARWQFIRWTNKTFWCRFCSFGLCDASSEMRQGPSKKIFSTSGNHNCCAIWHRGGRDVRKWCDNKMGQGDIQVNLIDNHGDWVMVITQKSQKSLPEWNKEMRNNFKAWGDPYKCISTD